MFLFTSLILKIWKLWVWISSPNLQSAPLSLSSATWDHLTRRLAVSPTCVRLKKRKKKSAPAQASPSGTRTVTGASLEHFEAIVWQWLLTWDPRPTGKLPPEGPFRGQLFKLSTITLLSPSRFVQPLSAAHRKACEESEVTFLNVYSRTVACCVALKKNILCLLYARSELQPSA